MKKLGVVALGVAFLLSACASSDVDSAAAGENPSEDTLWWNLDRSYDDDQPVEMVATDVYMVVGPVIDRESDDSSPRYDIIDIGTSEVRWSLDAVEPLWVTEHFVVQPASGELHVYNIASGSLANEIESFSTETDSLAVTQEAYITVKRDGRKHRIVARDLESESELWSDSLDDAKSYDLLVPEELSDLGEQATPDIKTIHKAVSSEILYLTEQDELKTPISTSMVSVSDGTSLRDLEQPVSKDSVVTLATTTGGDYVEGVLYNESRDEHYGDAKTCEVTVNVVGADHDIHTLTTSLHELEEDKVSWGCAFPYAQPIFTDTVMFGQSDQLYPQVIDLESGKPQWTGIEAAMPWHVGATGALYVTPQQFAVEGVTEATFIDFNDPTCTWKLSSTLGPASTMVSVAIDEHYVILSNHSDSEVRAVDTGELVMNYHGAQYLGKADNKYLFSVTDDEGSHLRLHEW